MNDSQEKKLREIFREELSLNDSDLTDKTAYNELQAWDSLTHLKLISRIEEAFSIEMEVDDIIAMENYGKARALVGKYLQ